MPIQVTVDTNLDILNKLTFWEKKKKVMWNLATSYSCMLEKTIEKYSHYTEKCIQNAVIHLLSHV